YPLASDRAIPLEATHAYSYRYFYPPLPQNRVSYPQLPLVTPHTFLRYATRLQASKTHVPHLLDIIGSPPQLSLVLLSSIPQYKTVLDDWCNEQGVLPSHRQPRHSAHSKVFLRCISKYSLLWPWPWPLPMHPLSQHLLPVIGLLILLPQSHNIQGTQFLT